MRADLTMVARWLRTPEVVRWWGEPEEQIALVTADIDEPLMRQWIVEHDQLPFAYLQAYPVQAWPQAHLSRLPHGAEAIDAFIGVPEMIGRGHGSAFLRTFLPNFAIAEGATLRGRRPAMSTSIVHAARTRVPGLSRTMSSKQKTGVLSLMLFQMSSG